MVRDKVGSFQDKDSLTNWLQNWINRYIEPNPAMATEEEKASRPLAEAQVVVEEDPSNPGYYNSKFYLRPHYQLEGLTVSLRLTSRLPAG
jgi:type VI secretion system protein ImpC